MTYSKKQRRTFNQVAKDSAWMSLVAMEAMTLIAKSNNTHCWTKFVSVLNKDLGIDILYDTHTKRFFENWYTSHCRIYKALRRNVYTFESVSPTRRILRCVKDQVAQVIGY